MGTKNRPVATTRRLLKHTNPTEEDEKVPVPKLPSVKITKKIKQGPALSDFLDDKNKADNNANLQLKPVGKEKASEILHQYNKLVANEMKLDLKTLPPLKLPYQKNSVGKTITKHEATPRKVPIFTEGISSISKTTQPSFLIPKDKVLRANLPNNVILDHKKDNFSFGVKIPKRKSPKEDDGSSKFKQLHNLGLDSLPIVNLEKYMKNTGSVNGTKWPKPIQSINKKLKPRKLDPIAQETKGNLTTRSHDFSHGGKNKRGLPIYNSAKSEGRANVVWVGKTSNTEFAENRTRLLKGIHSQYDPRMKQEMEINQMRFQNRDPTVYGVCSLAPIDVIGQSTTLRVANQKAIDERQQRAKGEYKKYLNIHQTRSNVQDYFFESESDSSLNTNWKNMINNAMTNRSSSVGSGTVTPQGVPNPPPSYVSSTNEEDAGNVSLEISNTMHRIQEERSSVQLESASQIVHDTLNGDSNKLNLPSPPSIVIINSDIANVENEEKDKQIIISNQRSTPRRTKEVVPSSVIELKIDNKHLGVPKFIDSERRPPVKTDTAESSSQSQGSSDIVKAKQTHFGVENQKLNVKTLLLESTLDRNSPVPPFNTFLSEIDTKGIVGRNDNLNLESIGNGTEDLTKHFTVNNKTLQFISPLHTQSNAKRQ